MNRVTNGTIRRWIGVAMLGVGCAAAGCRAPSSWVAAPDPGPADMAQTLPVEPGLEPLNAAQLAQTYRLQPGDRIRLEVMREPDLSGEFDLNATGTIHHLLLGKVDLAGLTVEAAEARLHASLAADYLVDPRVTVVLLRWAQRPAIVFGEVKSPGAYDIPAGQELTLLQLIARAGGFTDIAALDRVRIVRSTGAREETRRVRVSDILRGGGRGDVSLRPGDVVIVPRTFF